MRLYRVTARRGLTPDIRDRGGALTGVLVAVLILAAVAVGAFFYFGGEADVNIKKPDVSVTSSETPN